MSKTISDGTVHKVSSDLRKVLMAAEPMRRAWEDITVLARNEWICWIESAKKIETREHRIQRTREDLVGGKRRPCCWAGCTHR